MTKNASYKNELFSIASKELLQKGGKVHFGIQPLMDNCKTFFFARQNSIATFVT
jgi:hypothetical protein